MNDEFELGRRAGLDAAIKAVRRVEDAHFLDRLPPDASPGMVAMYEGARSACEKARAEIVQAGYDFDAPPMPPRQPSQLGAWPPKPPRPLRGTHVKLSLLVFHAFKNGAVSVAKDSSHQPVTLTGEEAKLVGYNPIFDHDVISVGSFVTVEMTYDIAEKMGLI